jgi:3D (Asp-Asp-Asp) domain-containing protein
MRDGPGLAFAAFATVAEGALVRILDGPRFDRDGRAWYRISALDERGIGDERAFAGWSAGEFLARPGVPASGTIQSFNVQPPAVGRQISARVSAYTYQVPGNGAHGTITRSGTVARWGTAAVDPDVIPLGSRLRIEGFDTVFVAEDTGGAVFGNRIEVFYPDEAAAIQFGVRYLQVTVIDEAPLRRDVPAPVRP